MIEFYFLVGLRRSRRETFRTFPHDLTSESGFTLTHSQDYLLAFVGSVVKVCSIRGTKFPDQPINCHLFKEKSMIYRLIAPIYRVTMNASRLVAH